MLKRMLHAANQTLVHTETHTGTGALSIPRTVNDKVDMLAVQGDSWQLVQEQGKNLLNPDEVEIGGLTGNTGINFAATTRIRTGYIPVEEGKKYALSGYSYGIANTHIFDSSKTRIGSFNNGGEIITGGKYVRVAFKKTTEEDFTEEELQELKQTLMFEEGDTATDYEPFQPAMPSPEYPSEIINTEGNVESSGWNLCPIKCIMSKDNNLGSFILGITEHGTYILSADITKYFDDDATNTRIVIRIYYTDGTYTQESSIPDIKNQERDGIKRRKTVSVTSDRSKNISYIRLMTLYYGSSPTGTRNAKSENIQVVKGDVTKPYDRHRGNSITLPTLRSLPDGTRDALYVDRRNKRAWVERNVGVVEFDGSEDEKWRIHSDNGFYICNTGYMKVGRYLDGYCNRFLDKKSLNVQSVVFGYDNEVIYFPHTFDIADTLETWKSWLSTNPIIVLYPLAEPTIEELPCTDYLLETAQYQTNICMTDLDEHLQPEITATVKVIGN